MNRIAHSDLPRLVSWLGRPLGWSGRAKLLGIAVVGSCLYGASLALVIPGWAFGPAAIWLALSAGLAWLVFIPAFLRVTRLEWWNGVEACLATMACGEVVLVLGAVGNVLLAWTRLVEHAAAINGLVVLISNITMAIVLARIVAGAGVRARQTLFWWMLALNGSGALFFWTFHRWLRL